MYKDNTNYINQIEMIRNLEKELDELDNTYYTGCYYDTESLICQIKQIQNKLIKIKNEINTKMYFL